MTLADGTTTTFDGENPDVRYEQGGEIEGEYSSLREFLENNTQYIPFLSEKYGIDANDWEEYVQGELDADEEVIETILGDGYKVFYNESNDVFEIIKKKDKTEITYKISIATKYQFRNIEKVIADTGIYSEYTPRFVVTVNNEIIGGSTFFVDENNIYHFDC
jgi:hypothetical protein